LSALAGLKNSAVQSSRITRFSCWASNFSFSLGQWAKAQASHLPTKKKKTKTLRHAQGKQNLRATCPMGKMDFKFFFEHCLGTTCTP